LTPLTPPNPFGEDARLRRLLASRDERAAVQRALAGVRGVTCLVQIMINIPGLPKSLERDFEAMRSAGDILLDAIGSSPAVGVFLRNYAGPAGILAFAHPCARDIKTAAMRVEDENEWGRAFDMDVITSTGQLSRTSLGGRARSCALCGEPAKICARERRHPVTELREEIRRLLSLVPQTRRPSDNFSIS
jgi:holo-ACP synthase CitX